MISRNIYFTYIDEVMEFVNQVVKNFLMQIVFVEKHQIMFLKISE